MTSKNSGVLTHRMVMVSTILSRGQSPVQNYLARVDGRTN